MVNSNFPKKVMLYFKSVTFSALLVTAITFCPPMNVTYPHLNPVMNLRTHYSIEKKISLKATFMKVHCIGSLKVLIMAESPFPWKMTALIFVKGSCLGPEKLHLT